MDGDWCKGGLAITAWRSAKPLKESWQAEHSIELKEKGNDRDEA